MEEYRKAETRGLVGPVRRPAVKDEADDARRWLGIDVGTGSADTFHVARRPAATSTEAGYPEPNLSPPSDEYEPTEDPDDDNATWWEATRDVKRRLSVDLEAGRVSVDEARRRYQSALTEQVRAHAADPRLDLRDLDWEWQWTSEDDLLISEDDEYDALARREGVDIGDLDDRPDWERRT